MNQPFQRIALIGKPDAKHIGPTLSSLHEHLGRRGNTVLVERSSACFIDGAAPGVPLEDLGGRCDLAIVIGGDGSLLNAARVLAQHDIPLIGVNLGRLGFLVDISPQHALTSLDEILQGRFRAEERQLLEAKVLRDGRLAVEQTAVNDVVVHSGNSTSMIEIVTLIDGVFLNSQRSDGLIVSTPTGSTAYALSSGGPIVHPALKVIALVPVSPHTLSNRPVVISSDSRVEIVVRRGEDARAHFDSHSHFNLREGDRIVVRRYGHEIKLLHPVGHSYFSMLREKLNWNRE